MNGLMKVASRMPQMKNVLSPLGQAFYARNVVRNSTLVTKRQFARNIWHMCSSRSDAGINTEVKLKRHTSYDSQFAPASGDKELVEFLNEEIAAEKKSMKMAQEPAEFEGFQVQFDGSDVNLTKKLADETITISFNVNHTVDAEPPEPQLNPKMDKPELGEMKSKPSFEVDITKGNKTLSFTCSFIDDAEEQQQPSDDSYGDIFGIDEMTMFEGEWNEKVYAVSGEILDGYLYDLLMSQLEDRGISNEFVDKLSQFSTQYEHKSYVNLLEKLQKFASGK
ncbi:complement component 1 Q subcomponent-binding protein, mitochondrial isoform X2 [Ischnura elegans]|uniref:complement component 1 Q subcomponent-binding protein, mitochondrial isoform X2 n=1 Tax=Ischnura elegans TaxID=197161 RepID=UPI001ED8A7F6|nr:complement component 1 Q subcomponent-binding protein, mitochondrial isoform X2 [Ischnura elegans]